MTPVRRKLAPNEVLYREGQPPTSFFVVLSGVISLFSEREGRAIEKARLGANSIVGELAYFNPQPRTSSARAVVETEVVEFPFEQIQADLKQLPGWVQLMMKNYGEQLTATARELRAMQGESAGKLSIDDILRGTAALRSALMTLPSEDGAWDWEKVREYAVQVFQFPGLKLEPLAQTLAKAEWLAPRSDANGNLAAVAEPQLERIRELAEFIRHYRHSRGKRGVIEMTQADLIGITALIQTADGKIDGHRGAARVFLPDALVAAQKLPGGSNYRVDQFDLLINRGLDIVKQSTEDGLYVSFNLSEFEKVRDNWRVLLTLA